MPALRPEMLKERLPGGSLYQMCERCVMDTSDPEITFHDGGCIHCSGFLDKRSSHPYSSGENQKELHQIIDDVRRNGRRSDYDCIIGMSGGVDSSYLAYLVCKEFGLRPLAVHMDNGWDSAVSVRNIRNLVESLGLDYECVVLDWKEFRRIQLAFIKASVPEAETPTDVAIPEVLHSIAAAHNVRYIISGGNLATEGILPKAWHYNARDRKYFESICMRFGNINPKKFKFYDYRREMYYKVVLGIKTIYPLNYLAFNKDATIKLLTDRLGFEYYGQKHHESLYSRFIQGYYLPEKFGIDYRRATYSAMILDGQMNRQNALQALDDLPYHPDLLAEDKRYIAKKLAISISDLEEFIARPGTWYWEHPNDEGKLAVVYSVYRALYGKSKLASV